MATTFQLEKYLFSCSQTVLNLWQFLMLKPVCCLHQWALSDTLNIVEWRGLIILQFGQNKQTGLCFKNTFKFVFEMQEINYCQTIFEINQWRNISRLSGDGLIHRGKDLKVFCIVKGSFLFFHEVSWRGWISSFMIKSESLINWINFRCLPLCQIWSLDITRNYESSTFLRK